MYQCVPAPETWLPEELCETMKASPATLAIVARVRFRLQALASRWGNGGLAHPTEPTARDIVSLALLDADDMVLMSYGIYWVREFKGMLKPLEGEGAHDGSPHTRLYDVGRP